MKAALTLLGIAAVVAVAFTFDLAHGRQDANGELVFLSPAEASFEQADPLVSTALLWGDYDEGPYGMFTKFEPGYDAGMHMHTNDLQIVGIEGSYVYRDEAGEKRVGPGAFLFIPGGTKHWSGGDAEEGAVFYQASSAGFDLVPVED